MSLHAEDITGGHAITYNSADAHGNECKHFHTNCVDALDCDYHLETRVAYVSVMVDGVGCDIIWTSPGVEEWSRRGQSFTWGGEDITIREIAAMTDPIELINRYRNNQSPLYEDVLMKNPHLTPAMRAMAELVGA